MSDLASSLSKLNDIETAGEAPLTESLVQKIGANINGLIDANTAMDTRVDALESYTNGAAYTASAASIGTSLTAVSLTVTLTASDYVMLVIGNHSSTLAGGSSITGNDATLSDGSAGTRKIEWKRATTVVKSVSAASGNVTAQGVYIDKPGAGTFTYTVVLTAPNSGGFTGAIALHKVEG